MSRSGYYEDDGGGQEWAMICWRGAVASAIRGKRGQAMLKEVLVALDALPEKILAAESLVNAEGQYCTLGALGRARGIDMEEIDPEDYEEVAKTFGVAGALAREIMWLNDEEVSDHKWIDVEIFGPVRPYYPEYGKHFCSVRVPNENQDKERFELMRKWVSDQIIPAADGKE